MADRSNNRTDPIDHVGLSILLTKYAPAALVGVGVFLLISLWPLLLLGAAVGAYLTCKYK